MFGPALRRRLVAAAYHLLHGQPKPRPPTRVGLLDSGELIVLPGRGGHLVLSADTTDQVRQVLAQDEAAASLLVHPIGGAPLGDHFVGGLAASVAP